MESKAPIVAAQWHPTKNVNLQPTDVTASSNQKVWWLCSCGNEWLASIYKRTSGSGCPACARKESGKKRIISLIAANGSLQDKNPTLAKEWHTEKNGTLKPSDVTTSSNKKVWWQCSYGHEWQATISNRSNGKGCPICRRNAKKSVNDLLVPDS